MKHTLRKRQVIHLRGRLLTVKARKVHSFRETYPIVVEKESLAADEVSTVMRRKVRLASGELVDFTEETNPTVCGKDDFAAEELPTECEKEGVTGDLRDNCVNLNL